MVTIMKYKIGKISRLLNLSTEGIRFYEKNGIVAPKKELYSSTRYYDVWDIHILMRARAYRRLGFSIQEIYDVIHSGDIPLLTDALSNKERLIEEEIIEKMNLLKRNREIKSMVTDAEKMLNKYRIEFSPHILRFNTQNCNALINEPRRHLLASEWISHAPFTFTSAIFPKDEILSNGKGYFLGFGIGDDYARYLNITPNNYIHRLPAHLSVFTVFASSSDSLLSPARLAGALDVIQNSGLELAGDAFSIVINFHKTKDIYRNYHLVWLPVKDHTKDSD